ncbi:MAG: hypothetical protein WCB94_02745 [Terriglobales bacterium]
MPSYPVSIRRCQQLKVNGTQCGSPALRDSKFCYYHIRYHWPELQLLKDHQEWVKRIPTLEDANSIQVTLADVIYRLMTEEVDHKTAALLLYALQTASMNLKRTTLEPELPTQVVIDRETVARRPIGATAWSTVEGREYDEVESVAADAKKNGVAKEELSAEPGEDVKEFMRLCRGVQADPDFVLGTPRRRAGDSERGVSSGDGLQR